MKKSTVPTVKVVKIPLDDYKKLDNDRAPNFPKLPRLYLELLENKSKIKQHLVNKERSPVFIDDVDAKLIAAEAKPEVVQDDIKPVFAETTVETKTSDEKPVDESGDDKSPGDGGYESDGSQVEIPKADAAGDSPASVDSLTDKLTRLMDDDEASIASVKQPNYKYSKHRQDVSKVSVSVKHRQVPPSLAEIEANGGFRVKPTLPNITNAARNEEEDDMKRELMFRFGMLAKSYPETEYKIPEVSLHTDVKTMQRLYDDSVRRLSLDSAVDSYKKYLIYLFMGCEFVMGKFFKIEMDGFTSQQILSMSSYEKLLIELGEKSYVPNGSKFPVEVRLLFLVIINAGSFLVSKLIAKQTGINLVGMLNNMNVPPKNERPKKKMRGPDIDVDSLP